MTKKLESALAGFARSLRAMLGAPDYERYLLHLRECHPGRIPLSREAFEHERLSARYSRPGSRCC